MRSTGASLVGAALWDSDHPGFALTPVSWGAGRIVHRSDAGPHSLAVLAFSERPVELEIVQHSSPIRVVRDEEKPV